MQHIFCPNKHHIGTISKEGIVIKHRKRMITIPVKESGVWVIIQCDRCGESTKLFAKSEKNIELTLLTDESGGFSVR